MSHIHHHEKRTLLVNLFTIPMFIVILIVLTIFNKPVSRIVNLPYKLVAGTHDSRLQDLSKENFTKELASDTKDQLDTIKTNVFQTTIGDLVTFLGKSEQIKKDVNNLGDEAKKMFDNLHFDPVKQLNK